MGFMDNVKGLFSNFKADFVAGLIVAIVALPLAIGFAIASGVPPVMGVYAAIFGGLVAAIFGGSEFQITGPTGAMVVIVLAITAKYGVDGLLLATFVAGIILLLLWIFKLGKAIEYIPYPVIVGFTAGIATLLFFGQLNNFFGISPAYPAGAGFFTKTVVSLANFMHANIYTVILAVISILILVFTKKFTKKIPGSIIAIILGLAVAFFFNGYFHLMTVGDVGVIPSSIPMPHVPHFTWELLMFVMPGALTIAALAAIESLLSAVVGDGMTGKKHDSNKELRGQGLANIASALFGGIPITGAIARTATNVRSGAKSRLAGIIHALILLAIILALGPVFSLIPLAVIAGILMYVAFNMVEWNLVFEIFKMPLSDVAVMIVTFALTIFVDLTAAIEVGIVLAALLFMKRMGDLYQVEEHGFTDPDESYDSKNVVQKFHHPDISIYTLNGPLFFGAAAKLDQELGSTPGSHKPIKIIRMKYVSVIDATGITALRAIVKHHKKMGGTVLLSTVQPNVYGLMEKSGLIEDIGPEHIFRRTSYAFKDALRHSHELHKLPLKITDEEMKKYDLTAIEHDDRHIIKVNDKDPVQEMLDNSGITKIHRTTVHAGRKVGKAAVTISKRHQKRLHKARDDIVSTAMIKSEKLEKMDRVRFRRRRNNL